MARTAGKELLISAGWLILERLAHEEGQMGRMEVHVFKWHIDHIGDGLRQGRCGEECVPQNGRFQEVSKIMGTRMRMNPYHTICETYGCVVDV